MRILLLFLGLFCAAAMIAGEALPVRSRVVEAGGFGSMSFHEAETQNLEKASRGICRWMLFAAAVAPFALLFKAFEFVKCMATMFAIGAFLAFFDCQSLYWNLEPASWVLMALGDAGLFSVAIAGEWWYARRTR